MPHQRLDKLLQRCTVRVDLPNGQGTGFFVAPGLILTCTHVVESVGMNPIRIFWKETEQTYTAYIERLIANPDIDLALLKLTEEIPKHPCVYFDQSTPRLDDRLYSFGYPETYPDGDSVTFGYEGESFKGNAPLHKLKQGQADYGLSGSPLLNQRTKGVCGIVNISRSTSSDLGARAVSTSVIISEFPKLKELNIKFYKQDNRWKRIRNRLRYQSLTAMATVLFLSVIVVFTILFFNRGDVALSVSVSNKTPGYFITNYRELDGNKERERTLTYKVFNDAKEIKISEDMKYFSQLKSGGPISDFGYTFAEPPYFDWHFPNLDLRIVNNTKKTIYITNVELEVKKSVIDLSPVLIIPGEEPNLFRFKLIDEGWGEIKNGSIRFNLVPFGQSISFDGLYEYEVKLGKFSDNYNGKFYNVDVSKILAEKGVNIKFLGSKDPKYTNSQYPRGVRGIQGTPDCSGKENTTGFSKEESKIFCDAIGLFKNGRNEKRKRYSAIAYGEIFFIGTTSEGKNKSSTIKFSTEVPILVGGGYGGNVLPTYQYDVKLDIDRENYKVTVLGGGSFVSQYLKAGETDRFNILIGVEKSSIHDFRLRLTYNNGQSLLSPPIKLEIFVPKSEASRLYKHPFPQLRSTLSPK